MSDQGGLLGALMLSDQISTDRMLDSFRRARQGSALAANDAAWRANYDNLVSQYNRLLQDANRLADVQDREIAAQKRQIAELAAANRAHEIKAEQMALDLAWMKASRRLARGALRELLPDVYTDSPEYD